uniref:Uncharacterized protein n=1 Tax=Micrurus corallinus TaxID=54390 RepID=A0A2D4GJ27_MICCO
MNERKNNLDSPFYSSYVTEYIGVISIRLLSAWCETLEISGALPSAIQILPCAKPASLLAPERCLHFCLVILSLVPADSQELQPTSGEPQVGDCLRSSPKGQEDLQFPIL